MSDPSKAVERFRGLGSADVLRGTAGVVLVLVSDERATWSAEDRGKIGYHAASAFRWLEKKATEWSVPLTVCSKVLPDDGVSFGLRASSVASAPALEGTRLANVEGPRRPGIEASHPTARTWSVESTCAA